MTSTDESLADSFYEAAFVPELWQSALTEFATHFGARESGVMVQRHDGVVNWAATEHCAARIQGYVDAFPDGSLFHQNIRTERFDALSHRGFKRELDLMNEAELDRDTFQLHLRSDDLEWQAFTRISLPGGDIAGFSIERTLAAGRFEQSDIARLDQLWPHLARASMTAARLGLDRARSAAATMDAIGLAAAVISPSGRVRATNARFDALPEVVRPAAHGRLQIEDAHAQDLFAEALARAPAARNQVGPALSIPIRPRNPGKAIVLHLLPLRRAAKDLFSGGEMMLVATVVGRNDAQPEPAVLQVLFDLTAAEARIAISIASGMTVAQAALGAGLTIKSARTYLERIFRKTGTARQSELVSLLRSTLPVPS